MSKVINVRCILLKILASKCSWFFRGTQQKILRKRLKNNKKARIKISEAILSILGDCWEKIYLFLIASKTNEEVSSQQGAPSTCNLTYLEVS